MPHELSACIILIDQTVYQQAILFFAAVLIILLLIQPNGTAWVSGIAHIGVPLLRFQRDVTTLLSFVILNM